MTKEELIEFLKENLYVSISISDGWDYGYSYKSVEVTLSIGDEVISKNSDTFSVPN